MFIFHTALHLEVAMATGVTSGVIEKTPERWNN